MGEILRRVRRFHEALDLAIHDRELEEAGAELLFFYDADVAIATIVGLTTYDRQLAPPEVSGPVYVVRALLNTGYLTTIRFLRPHLAEFHRFIKGLPNTAMHEGFHRAAMDALMKQWGLPGNEPELKRLLKNAAGFVDFIRKEGHEVFVKMELCLGGYWEQRLRRLLRAGRFDFMSGATDLPVPGDTEAHWFAQEMARWRGEHASLNNQVDAHALAELSRKTQRGLNVRFYTETEAVRNLFNGLPAPWREKLSDAYGKPIERSEDYFLIRSSFPSLGFRRESERRVPHPDAGAAEKITVEALKDLRGRLEEVLRSVAVPFVPTADEPGVQAIPGTAAGAQSEALERDPEDLPVEEALKAIAVGDMNLAELIERFYRLGFLESIFLSWEPPAEMQMWLPSLYVAKAEGQLVEGARQQLVMSLDQAMGLMGREIGQLREWRDDFIAILAAAADRARAFQGKRPDPWLDLGLGRWGLEHVLNDRVKTRLTDHIARLLDDATRESNCSDLAIQLAYGAKDMQELGLQLCLLWLLRLDELVCKTFERLPSAMREILPPWIRVLQQVAEVKTAGQRLRPGQTLVSELRATVDKAQANVTAAERGEWSSGYAEMGLAHVCYWAWRATGQSTDEPELEWARQSYLAGQRAERLLERGSLAWAFAVNHCAYMGVRAELFPEQTERYMETLVQDIPRVHYHYRFVDTEVWESTTKVRDEVRTNGFMRLTEDRMQAGLRRELCSELVRGRERLREFPHWGDTEVTRHIQTIEHYLSKLRCGRIMDVHDVRMTSSVAVT